MIPKGSIHTKNHVGKAITIDRLLEEKFYLPGKDTIIPISTSPHYLKPQKKEFLYNASVSLEIIKTKALAHMLCNDDLKKILLFNKNKEFLNYTDYILTELESEKAVYDYLLKLPTIHRLDFLRIPNIKNHTESVGLLEFNCIRPGGIVLSQVVSEILKDAGYRFHPLIPDITSLLSYFMSIIKEHNLSGEVNIALCWKKGYVAEYEMPILAKKMNNISNKNIKFYSYDRQELNDNGTQIINIKGKGMDIIYENSVPPFLFLDAELENRAVFINPAIQTLGANKSLLAILCSKEFQRKLTPAEIDLIQLVLPKTFLLVDTNDLVSFLDGSYKYYAFKPILGSSGKGLYMGNDMKLESLLKIKNNLNKKDEIYIAQKIIGSSKPFIKTEMINTEGKHVSMMVHGDHNPFVFNTGNGVFKTLGMLSRIKEKHPINLSQNGGIVVTTSSQ